MSARTAIVVGASSGIGRGIAAELAARGWALLLVASDERDVGAVANDLQLRFGVATRALALDLAVEADPGVHVTAALDGLPPAAALVLAAGSSRGDDNFDLAPHASGQLLAINLHAPLVLVDALLPQLVATRGVVVLLGSVAAVRGRGRNIAYSAAKRGLESLYESLRHAQSPGQLRVQLYRLGFVASNLTFGSALPLPAAPVAKVARRIAARIDHGSGRRYLPRWWAVVALVLRVLPWPLYRRVQG